MARHARVLVCSSSQPLTIGPTIQKPAPVRRPTTLSTAGATSRCTQVRSHTRSAAWNLLQLVVVQTCIPAPVLSTFLCPRAVPVQARRHCRVTQVIDGFTFHTDQCYPLRIERRHLDLNGDGSISLAEMAALMGELGVDADGGNGGAEAAAELMAAVSQADLGADGGIDFDTFLGFCRKACPRPMPPDLDSLMLPPSLAPCARRVHDSHAQGSDLVTFRTEPRKTARHVVLIRSERSVTPLHRAICRQVSASRQALIFRMVQLCVS